MNVQDAPALSVAPATLTLFDPGIAEIVPPPHVPLCPLGVATTRPIGNVSLKPTPLNEVSALGFDTLKVSGTGTLSDTLAEPKLFVRFGGTGLVTIVVRSLAVLFLGLVSPPPETAAVLVTVDGRAPNVVRF